MRANLYALDATGNTLMDGNYTEYSDIYSNEVDIHDAWKMTNPGVNFGILRSAIDLVVERRSNVTKNDTTFFRMWNMSQKNYLIKFILKDLDQPHLHCYVKDDYLKTQTAIGLDDTTDLNFTVNADPASAAEMRFQLVFVVDAPAPVDVAFTAIHALRNGNDIKVQWDIIHEQSIESYTVEHSADGINFNGLSQVNPYNNNDAAKTYYYTHLAVPKANNSYRIKAVRADGAIQYSSVVKLSEGTPGIDINVYPNPVVHKTVQMQFNNTPAGTYNLSLIYSNGMKQLLPSFQLADGQSTGTIALPQNLVPGIYRLQFIAPGNIKIIKTIRVL